jgi:hypothetical protein
VPAAANYRVEHRISAHGEEAASQTTLPPAALIILEPNPGGASLIRYSEGGAFAGDTWHRTPDEAKEQVQFEFGEVSWNEAPAGPSGVDEFAIATLRTRT